jgi:hypothetical protein
LVRFAHASHISRQTRGGKFTLDKESPIQGQEPEASRIRSGAGSLQPQFGRNYLANSGLNQVNPRSAAMRLQTYRDESRSRHFDLVGGGEHPRSIDLVVILTSILLVVCAACALIAEVDASGTVGLAHWVR